ncbi:MAG: class I SAM-dependent methyltransferase [Betaproteobacteria bacterium]
MLVGMLADAIFELIRPAFTLKSVFLQVGAGHFELALRAAGYVERVYAVDAPVGDARKLRPPKLPPNIVRVQKNGSGIPVPDGSVDVAFSAELSALPAIHRTLAPGGVCFCVAKGAEAGEMVRRSGFSKLRHYAGRVRVPTFVLPLLEGYRIVAVK